MSTLSTLVHIIIPVDCHRPSVEITYDLANAIEGIRIVATRDKKRSFPNKYIPMKENEDGSLCVIFTTVGGKDVIAATIDDVLHTFASSRWQIDTEKTVAMYDSRNLKRIVNKNSRKTIRYEYSAIADDV